MCAVCITELDGLSFYDTAIEGVRLIKTKACGTIRDALKISICRPSFWLEVLALTSSSDNQYSSTKCDTGGASSLVGVLSVKVCACSVM